MLQIIEPGLLTTIQDLGRAGYQAFGVTRGGAMDSLALRAANQLVGNAPDQPAIEIATAGFSVRALEKCVIAVTGAAFVLRIGERFVPSNAALFLRAGDTLTFDAPHWGRYAYLALAGGIDVPRVLGSRSTDLRSSFGGLEGRALRHGDILRTPSIAYSESDRTLERAGKLLPEKFMRYYRDLAPIRIIWGPHLEYFDAAARATLLDSEYQITPTSDRMGTRLHGTPISRQANELLSCGITRGAVQIPPNGQPIILQADAQTTGGYPILAAVIRADIPRLAQQQPDARVTFTQVTLAKAHLAYLEMNSLTK